MKKLRILHIEDNEVVIKMTGEMLSDHNYISTSDINEGLSIFKNQKIDVVLLDLRLIANESIQGSLLGFTFLENLTKEKLKANIVILSALTEQSKKAKLEYPGLVKAVVNKPFIKNDLINAINTALN